MCSDFPPRCGSPRCPRRTVSRRNTHLPGLRSPRDFACMWTGSPTFQVRVAVGLDPIITDPRIRRWSAHLGTRSPATGRTEENQHARSGSIRAGSVVGHSTPVTCDLTAAQQTNSSRPTRAGRSMWHDSAWPRSEVDYRGNVSVGRIPDVRRGRSRYLAVRVLALRTDRARGADRWQGPSNVLITLNLRDPSTPLSGARHRRVGVRVTTPGW